MAIVDYHPIDLFMIRPDDSLRLLGYDYDVPPALILDRRQVELPSEIQEFAEAIANYVEVAKSESSFVSLWLSGEADSASGKVFVKAAMDTFETGANLRLKCVITEDSVVDSMGLRYPRVARRFLPDLQGKPFAVARFDTLYDTLSFSCAGFQPGQLSAVVSVEDVNSNHALQAAELRRFVLKED